MCAAHVFDPVLSRIVVMCVCHLLAACRSELKRAEAANAAAAPRQLLASGQHGWQLSASCMAPLVGEIDGRQIRFGEANCCCAVPRCAVCCRLSATEVGPASADSPVQQLETAAADPVCRC